MAVPAPVEVQPPSSTLTPSLVRTLVPLLVGIVATWVARKLGLDPTDPVLSSVITVGFSYGYYVLARFLEVFASDKWGYILGLRKLPVYADPPLPATVIATPKDQPNPRRDLGEFSAGGALIVVFLVLLVIALLTNTHWLFIVSLIGVVAGVVVLAVGPRNGGGSRRL
jgi:hypothetical protein